MKITIINPTFQLVTGHFLARILQEKFDVNVIGYLQPGAKQIDTSAYNYSVKTITEFNYPRFLSSALKMIRRIDGDIVYPVALKPTSFGVAFVKKIISKIPLFIHDDDWQLGEFLMPDGSMPPLRAMRPQRYPNAYPYVRFMEYLLKFADEATVPNHQLQKLHGGTLIYHGVDTELFNPVSCDRKAMRDFLGLSDAEIIIMFIGQPRQHKGIEDILNALKKIGNPQIKLMIFRLQKEMTPYEKSLKNIGRKYLIIKPPILYQETPSYLSACDMVVLPNRNTIFSRYQLSMKVFLAMSMEKPIIASSISDFPMVLQDCGLLVEPGDVNGIAENIGFLVDNEDIAKEMGKRARQRAVTEYSYDAIKKKLFPIFEKYD